MQNSNNALLNQISSLRDKKGSIAFEDISGILENVASTLSSEASLESFLRNEIIKIANHIEATKNEIIGLSPEAASGQDMGTAAIQLDAVMKATEEAAHTIMDAVDEVQNVIAETSLEQVTKDKIADITTRIYEACNFQDLTGQRIKKVMKALEFTEQKINRLVSLFANDGSVNFEEFKKIQHDERPDAHLLNGPQLTGAPPSQDDIDAMFGDGK